jgi:hypothetical protein
MFDCSEHLIYQIVKGHRHTHVGGPIWSGKRGIKIDLQTAQQICRERVRHGTSYRVLGEKYGVSESMAYRICAGERWPQASVTVRV